MKLRPNLAGTALWEYGKAPGLSGGFSRPRRTASFPDARSGSHLVVIAGGRHERTIASPLGLYPGGAAGGDRHHRHPDRPAACPPCKPPAKRPAGAQCANNLKQISLAALLFNDTLQAPPARQLRRSPGETPPAGQILVRHDRQRHRISNLRLPGGTLPSGTLPWGHFGWAAYILPYMEQEALVRVDRLQRARLR